MNQMNHSNQCLIAEYESLSAAAVGLRVLETADFTDQTVSVVTRAHDESLAEIDRLRSRESDSPATTKSTGVGGLVGGALGAALGTMTMVGPLIVAGPLLGLAAGAGTGAALSQTERWGVDHDVIHRYEDRVAAGSVLVLVTDEPLRVGEAERLLKTTDPQSLDRFDSPAT